LIVTNNYIMAIISISVSDTVINQVKQLAEKDKRSTSKTIEILLERAMKERNRKTKKQENNENY